jgi:ribosomal subunit interface protein
MKVSVTARHCEVGTELKTRAGEIVSRLGQFSPHALESHVVFDVTAEGDWVEIRLHVRGGLILVATADASDHRTALDRAELKVKKQLERDVTRARRNRREATEP